MTATERHAIRHAIPKLLAIADDLASYEPFDLASNCDEHAFEIRAVVKDLLNALDGETPSEASDGGSGPTTAQECGGCRNCLDGPGGSIYIGMVVCTECGNKRCPKATFHRLDCTGSNESGQPGSAYQ